MLPASLRGAPVSPQRSWPFALISTNPAVWSELECEGIDCPLRILHGNWRSFVDRISPPGCLALCPPYCALGFLRDFQ